MLRRLVPVLAVSLLAAAADVSGLLQPLDHLLSDLRMTVAPRPPSGQIVLVDIDAKSLAGVGRWPWPRSVEATLIDRLREAGASEIAVDIDFSASSMPEEDQALESALARANDSVILAAFRQRETGAAGSAIVWTLPLDRFAKHGWVVSVNVRPDPDGVVRRMSYGQRIEGGFVPSLSATLGGGGGMVSQEFLVDFSIDAAKIDRVSAIDLLNGAVPHDRIAGKKVIVGSAAIELSDQFRVPVHGAVSGAMVQALAADTLIEKRALARSGSAITLLGLAGIAAALFFALAWARWLPLVGALLLASAALENVATLIQWLVPLSLHTAAWQAVLAGFAIVVMLGEIDLRRVLLRISRTQTRNTQTILDRVVHDNFAGVLVIDEAGEILAASRAAQGILGSGILAGRKAADVLPSELVDAMVDAIAGRKAGVAGSPALRELVLGRNDGANRFLEYTVTPSLLTGGVSFEGKTVADEIVACLTFSDVTDRRLAAERMEKLARFDTLTGLPNRNEFMERLDATLATGDEAAVVCVDLDRFNNVNDALGHNIGDLLLAAFAARLKNQAGPGCVVARVGSDDYAVVVAGGRAMTRAIGLADALLARVPEPFPLGADRVTTSLSIGIASGVGCKDARQLLKQADTALNRAKEAGGNRRITFAPEMIAGVEARQAMEMALWEALERNEFRVFYQPQVDLADGKIVGVEALLRWHHPERGMILPSEFIPLAEASGAIRPLGEWVLRTACAEVATWPVPLKLAVNVSVVQFMRGDLVMTVADALAHSGLPPERLELEITESLLMPEMSSVAATMKTLIDMGVQFALDDFGTGYSSLGYLAQLAIGKIKLDRSFIAGIPHDRNTVAIVQAVGLLANTLGIVLNAEGIESAEQVALLRLLGCKEGQGYLFGKAMPAEALLRLLQSDVAQDIRQTG